MPFAESCPRLVVLLSLAVLLLPASQSGAESRAPLTYEQLAAIRSARAVEISPDGQSVAYGLSVPRRPGEDDDGAAWMELHLVPFSSGAGRGYVTGEVNVSAIRFTPDSRLITYLAKRDGDEHRSLWAIPADGGESRRLFEFETDILDYRISPDGKRLAFIAREPESEARKRAREKGYRQEVFEEDWRPRKIWVTQLPAFTRPNRNPSLEEDDDDDSEPRDLNVAGSVYKLDWSPDGKSLLLAVAPRPLVDDSYMFQRIEAYDAASGEKLASVENRGKLGKIAFAPDGKHVALISGIDESDPMEGRLMVAPAKGGAPRDLLPDLLERGHVSDFAWQDGGSLVYVADVGLQTVLTEVHLSGDDPSFRFTSDPAAEAEQRGPVVHAVRVSADGKRAAYLGEMPDHPRELFTAEKGSVPRRRTDSNPWLEQVQLTPQETVRWNARDGLALEGLFFGPDRKESDGPPPLIVVVHGGPEGHFRNGWNTSYSRPAQLATGEGFALFYPNYRGSTGRGVAFSKLGQGDAAGAEFDDVIDGVDHLIDEGLVDGERVGSVGGSYGGYATAWLATRHTERFRAGVMFVGISNKLSKALTTDIPHEDWMVHTRYEPWTRFEYSMERSPLSYVEQSRTPLLIAGGTADSRVNPSQSLQFYRALKLVGKTPVRYVRYPGEGHGNRKAAARDDYTRRLLRWMRHFLMDGATELPPWDLGLGAEDEDDDEEEDGE
jgi:dipeptidyl aminopeptidase/acylaminoacyl peptidase